MAALNFPPSPALNDVFTSSDRSWKFNGVAWQLMPRTTDNIAEGTTNLYYTDARVAAAPAVTALQTDLATEVSTRTTEIARIDTRVDNVLSNIDSAALDSLTEVVAAFQDADGSLSTTIANLTSSSAAAATAEQDRALAAEGVLTVALAAEVTAREAAISTEQSARAAADSAEETRALAAESAEETRALAAESAEETRALAAESALSTAISTEVTDRGVAVLAEQDRALAAEAALSTRVDNVLSNIDPAALDSLTEVVSAFQSADSSINGAITSLAESAAANLTTERDARIAADSVIDTTVSTLTDSIPDRVRAVLLSGLSLATNAAITASDSVLGAFGKLQAQVTAAFASIDSEVATRTSEISRVELVISDTAPAHIAGREWLDTTDFRRYISISSAWVESITA